MTAAPVKIAVLGAGLIGRRHIEHILAAPEAALHGIVDPSPAVRDYALAHNFSWHPDFKTMLATGRPDALIAATPTRLHVPDGLAAVAAGIPALIEKPLADDLTAGTRLVEAAEKAGVPLLVGHHRRHNPMVRRAREIITSGRLGRIVTVHSFFWTMKPDDYFDIAWRREAGAGPVLTNLIHDIDLLRHFCGEIESVQAAQSNMVRGHGVEETAVAILKFVSGALGTVNVSDTVVAPWNWEQTAGENPAYPRTDQSCYNIAGTHGSLCVPRLELWTNGTERGWLQPLRTERLTAPDQDPLRLQIEHFCRVARGEEKPLVSGREGLKTLQVIMAVKQAAAGGASVRIEP